MTAKAHVDHITGFQNHAHTINPLECRGNYSATFNNTKLVHWRLSCYVWHSDEGPKRAAAPPSPFLAVPNVTAHPV